MKKQIPDDVHDELGREKGGRPPRSIPVKYRRPPTKFEEFQRFMKTASYLAKQEGFDSLEEFEDFSIDEGEYDPMPDAPHELVFEPSLDKEVTKAEADFLAGQRKAFEARFGKEAPWWKRAFQKKQPKPDKEVKKTSGEPSPEVPPEAEE